MGLRHRAALGISEVSDAVAVVVSEETGLISVVQNGRMIRRLDRERLERTLQAFFQSAPAGSFWSALRDFWARREPPEDTF
jgi:diadenylate cyclase